MSTQGKRRSRGEGGLHFDSRSQRWIATVTVGYDGRGKRRNRTASGKTKTEAKEKLKEMLRDLDDGLGIAPHGYTVANAVDDWLTYGLSGRDKATVEKLSILARTHVIAALGARKLRELTADNVDQWLSAESKSVSTRTLQDLRSILKRAITRAQARDKVKRNVVLLCELPKGQTGRPSKSLSFEEAQAVLAAADEFATSPGLGWLQAYVVVSLLTGARTEEMRALRWNHIVAYDEASGKWRPVTEIGWSHRRFAIHVWRSVRATGDTKTRKSRRTLALPRRCVRALQLHQERQDRPTRVRGALADDGLVFTTAAGHQLDKDTVRRAFRKVTAAAGHNPNEWTPRELRHTFVSVLSDNDMPIEKISDLVGHKEQATTETVYRHQIRPVVLDGAEAMDRIFPSPEEPDGR
jgi:integrase